jgi:hypothetical protein
MTLPADPPLEPPPRKAHLARGVRHLRRGYSMVFALVIIVFAGWACLDLMRWPELSDDQRALTVGFTVAALLAFIVWFFMDSPLQRDLRLARRGLVAVGQISDLRKGRGRRPPIIVTYVFHTPTGETITGACKLPRRFPADTLEIGAALEILYQAKKPKVNKPRVALAHIEFGEMVKQKEGREGV